MIEYIQNLSANNPIINLLLVMVIIWTAGVLFRRIKQPPILGELLGGIIFGPPLLGIIQPDETLHVLSELGVFFLMFYTGLETDPATFKRFSFRAMLVAAGGFFLPFIFGYSTCAFFGFTTIKALYVGLALSITAIAVNSRVMNDLKLSKFRISPVIIGASVIDDVLSLVFFSILIEMAGSGAEANWLNVLIVVLKVLVFFSFVCFVGTILYPKIGRHFASREAKGFTFSLIMALLLGVAAEMAGLHIILGAYMAGLFVRKGIVSEDLIQKINDRFVSITYGFLGPIFFVSLAFHVTFGILKSDLFLLLTFLIAAVAGKFIGSGGGALLGKMTRRESAMIGCAMNGRGAVELIFASIGLSYAIIDERIFSVLVFIGFITTLAAPFLLSVTLEKREMLEE